MKTILHSFVFFLLFFSLPIFGLDNRLGPLVSFRSFSMPKVGLEFISKAKTTSDSITTKYWNGQIALSEEESQISIGFDEWLAEVANGASIGISRFSSSNQYDPFVELRFYSQPHTIQPYIQLSVWKIRAGITFSLIFFKI